MSDTPVWISGASSGIGKALAENVPWDAAGIIDISCRGAPGAEHLGADTPRVSCPCPLQPSVSRFAA